MSDLNEHLNIEAMFDSAYINAAQGIYDRIWNPVNQRLVETTNLSLNERCKAANAMVYIIVRDYMTPDSTWERVPKEMRDHLLHITSHDARPCSVILFDYLIGIS